MNASARSENAPLYVIGDIHGRLDLLDRMIEAIRRDAGEQATECLTVTVGDYIDRGPESRGVIERLMGNPFPGRYVALRGNHEAILEGFLLDARVGNHWQHLGGLETLRSFGVSVSPFMAGQDFERAAEQLRAALTPEETKFLASLRMSLSVGRYFICHAGVRPGIPLEQQSQEDLLWIREAFLLSNEDFGKVIVHGHTPTLEPEVRANRINVDTGAFFTGRLTCVVLEDGGHRFLTAR
jgi:Calcineurin-like phosphoesterase